MLLGVMNAAKAQNSLHILVGNSTSMSKWSAIPTGFDAISSLSANNVYIGVGWEMKIKGNFYFEPQMALHQKGNHFLYTTSGLKTAVNSIQVNLRYSCLEVPLLLKHKVEQKKIIYYTSLGVAPAYMLRGEGTFINQFIGGDNPFYQKESKTFSVDGYNRFDLSALAGFGVEYSITPNMALNLDVRAFYGLLKFIKKETIGSQNFMGVTSNIGIIRKF